MKHNKRLNSFTDSPDPGSVLQDIVVLVDYDPTWPQLFRDERSRLQSTVGDALIQIEHIGSTSVPGLAAKPIVDIMAAVQSLSDAEASIPALESLGYTYINEFEHVMPERRYFRRQAETGVGYNLHVVEPTTEFWMRHLLFRDYLRSHPDTAQQYEHLKRSLAEQYRDDRASYTDAKTDFIEEIIHQARLSQLTQTPQPKNSTEVQTP